MIQGKTFDQIDWTNCIPTNDIPVVSFKSYFEQLLSEVSGQINQL